MVIVPRTATSCLINCTIMPDSLCGDAANAVFRGGVLALREAGSHSESKEDADRLQTDCEIKCIYYLHYN